MITVELPTSAWLTILQAMSAAAEAAAHEAVSAEHVGEREVAKIFRAARVDYLTVRTLLQVQLSMDHGIRP